MARSRMTSMTMAWLALAGCSGAGTGLPGAQRKKAESEKAGALGGGDKTADATDPTRFLGKDANALNAKYNVSVDAIFKKICEGQMQFKIRTQPEKDGQLFELPYGKLKCAGGLLGEFNLAEMLGTMSGGGKDSTALVVQDSVIRAKGLMQTVYQKPYRPFLPSFLAGKPDDLRSLSLSEPVTVADTKAKVKSSGTVSMRMLSFGVPYSPKKMPGVTLPNTLTFRVENQGFDGLDDKLGALLFPVMEMTISLSPVAIVAMHFETKMKDLMKSGEKLGMTTGGPLGELLVGNAKVSIDIDLLDQQGLKKFIEQDQASRDPAKDEAGDESE